MSSSQNKPKNTVVTVDDGEATTRISSDWLVNAKTGDKCIEPGDQVSLDPEMRDIVSVLRSPVMNKLLSGEVFVVLEIMTTRNAIAGAVSTYIHDMGKRRVEIPTLTPSAFGATSLQELRPILLPMLLKRRIIDSHRKFGETLKDPKITRTASGIEVIDFTDDDNSDDSNE